MVSWSLGLPTAHVLLLYWCSWYVVCFYCSPWLSRTDCVVRDMSVIHQMGATELVVILEFHGNDSSSFSLLQLCIVTSLVFMLQFGLSLITVLAVRRFQCSLNVVINFQAHLCLHCLVIVVCSLQILVATQKSMNFQLFT